MAFTFPDSARDAAITEATSLGDRVIACEGAPSSYSDADTLASQGGHKVAERTIDSATGYDGPNAETDGRSYDLEKGGYVALETRNGSGEGVDHLAVVDDDAQAIVELYEVGDGNGDPVKMEKGIAYNNLSITTTIGAVSAA